MIAPPVSYSLDGEQYVTILTGAGGGGEGSADEKYGSIGRVVTLKLGGTVQLPEPSERDLSIPEPPPLVASAEEVSRGEVLYGDICTFCHGPGARSAGGIPDLRRSNAETHAAWQAIVRGGSKKANGMASFADLLSVEDAERIRQFVIWRAAEDRKEALQASAAE